MASGSTNVTVGFDQESKRRIDKLIAAVNRLGNDRVVIMADGEAVATLPIEQDPDVRYRVFDLLTKESDLPPLSTVSANAIISRLENNGIRFVDSEG